MKSWGGFFDPENLNNQLEELEKKLQDPDLWKDHKKLNGLNKEKGAIVYANGFSPLIAKPAHILIIDDSATPTLIKRSGYFLLKSANLPDGEIVTDTYFALTEICNELQKINGNFFSQYTVTKIMKKFGTRVL